jgi:hypothetical protein
VTRTKNKSPANGRHQCKQYLERACQKIPVPFD